MPTPREAGIVVEVVREGGDWGACEPCEAAITAAAAAAARRLRIEWAVAAVALCPDSRVRELNKAYRGKDRATNVLSFPAPGAAQAAGRRRLGDIALAAETLIREAREQGIEPRHHLQHLVVHGLLHLLGHEHERDGDAEAMEALEIEILADLGIDNPYAHEARPARSNPTLPGRRRNVS
jgi:probable rRNA maturation factor